MQRTIRTALACALGAALSTVGLGARAADWSDTSIGFRTGNKYAEPFGRNDIHKNILNLTHASGYKYGSNFFNVDYLMSDRKDPGSSAPNAEGATETYIVYRHTLDIEKVSGTSMKFGPVRALGLTAGFDVNAKTDAGYNSKKRMLVLGPTVSLEVPGFLNVGVLLLRESNAPCSTFGTPSCVERYTYKTHPMLSTAWSIPIGGTGLAFEGFALWIASKGTDEFGGGTKPETNIDAQLMYDLPFGSKSQFRVGLEYQYWRNKFGNDHKGPAGRGAFAKTPMIRAEYHF